MSQATLDRAQRLLGAKAMDSLNAVRVILFGVGGVGSWCAEALVRTGVTHITIVDPDVVCASNVNRQLMATTLTIGRPKVEALREHLLAVNPEAEVVARQEAFTPETSGNFNLSDYDYVIDAIDPVPCKAHLILQATRSTARLFSSMGAAMKTDPQQVAVAEFWKVQGCPLARALRNKFKKEGTRPSRKFKCVYSPQLVPNAESPSASDPGNAEGVTSQGRERSGNGSLLQITGTFGFTLASLVINDCTQPNKE